MAFFASRADDLIEDEFEEDAREPLLPDSWSAALRRRAAELAGLALAAMAAALALASDWVRPRLALVGDAAHSVHPIAGQGLNLGVRDAAALAEVLVEARRRGEDIGALDVLERYQRWRRFETTTLALGMDAVNRLFSTDAGPARLVRDAGLALVDRMPGLRRAFMRQATGQAEGAPRMLRGEAL